MSRQHKNIFGPVPSRRLGRSLGVDIIPLKSCTQNCLYCQLGVDAPTTVEFKEYGEIAPILAELHEKLEQGVQADYITISGSGEPTLNSRLGELIGEIKTMTDIPVAVITNGTLLWNPKVRENLKHADLVMPSLDAGDETTFQKVNRPNEHITFEKFVNGLIDFTNSFDGQVWLEVFMIDGYNTDDDQVAKIAKIIEQINPDRIQLNTAVRPTAVEGVSLVSPEKLEAIAKKLGPKAEVIADYSKVKILSSDVDVKSTIAETISRRPCSLEDLEAGLGFNRSEILKSLSLLESEGGLSSEKREDKVYYFIKQ